MSKTVERTETERVLVVEDDEAYRRLLVGELADFGFPVEGVGDGNLAMETIQAMSPAVVLLDIRLPGLDGIEVLRRVSTNGDGGPQVVMLTGHGTIDTAIEAMKLGAYDYLTKPCDIAEMRAVIERALERRRLKRENAALRTILRRREGEVELIGRSRAIHELETRLARIGPTDANVLLLGESGTGKELAAHLVHRKSRRADKAFVDLNCGALPESLFESEFFGHEKGAFTGATSRKSGLVEAADGGTLFLDEVSEMPLPSQVKLLRFLETGGFRRLGGVNQLTANVRVVAASNRSLESLIEGGGFRRDLFFRLAVVTIEVPSLRERRDDVPLLAEHFMRRAALETGCRVSSIEPAAVTALSGYDWPGNVRELRNAIESAVILSDGNAIRARDLPARVLAAGRAGGEVAAPDLEVEDATLAEIERRHIEQTLERYEGHRDRTARALGIATKTLYRKLREFEKSK